MQKPHASTCLRGVFAIDRIATARPAPQGFPVNPITLGDHIRHHRLKRGLLQKDVAHILNVNEMTVTNWENNKRTVHARHIPKVVEFLGFVPDVLKDFQPLKSNIFLYRCKHGITQREMIERTKSLMDKYHKFQKHLLAKITYKSKYQDRKSTITIVTQGC